MTRIARTIIAAVFGFAIAVPASAGIVDSPLPELLPGETTFHVYSVPGIICLRG